MTAISTLNLAGLISNFSLFIFGIALAGIALWQSRHSRLNQYLALTMGFMALWGLFSALLQAPRQFELDMDRALPLSTSAYFIAVLALFFFITEFEAAYKLSRPILAARLLEVVWVVVILVFLWTGEFWKDAERLLDDSAARHMTTPALLLSSILIIYHAAVLIALLRRPYTRPAPTIIASLPLFLGALAVLSDFPMAATLINHVLALVSILLIARILLRDQLFNPMMELYQELMQRNTELMDASRVKSEFLANMSHELRTPLNSINGYTELLLNNMYGALGAEQRDRLEKINRNGQQLLQLINNVLDISKIDAGRVEIQPTYLSPTQLIDEALATLQPLAEAKRIKFKGDYHELPTLYVDEARARQIIVNIVANMIEVVQKGDIQVSGYVNLTRHQVVIVVSDSQSGIRAEDAKRLGQIISGVYSGEGLGLAISKRLAELHGGQVAFESTPNEASSFSISLPAALQSTTIPAKDAEQLEVAPDTMPSPVLVIDRDVQAIEVIQDHLRSEGYRVIGALSDYEGILRSRELTPQAIFLAIAMPGDARAVLAALKADERLRQIPVFALISDRGTLPDTTGMVTSLYKPVTRRALLNALQLSRQQSVAMVESQPV